MHARPQRIVLVALVAALLSGFAAAGSAGQSTSLRFTELSQRTGAGQMARVAVVVRPTGVRCSVSVRYADGTAQRGLKARRAFKGRVRWTWRVPATKPAGTARVTVFCARAGRRIRAITIVKPPVPPPPPANPVVRASVTAESQGFSQRSSRTGTSSTLSYGIILANPSPDHDALDVSVLINAVDASNRVVQTETEHVDAVASLSTFALGGSMSLSGTLVERLELVVEMRASAPKSLRYPTISNPRVVGSTTDKGYVRAVEGELFNGLESLVLTRSDLSIVLFDAGGNVVGGGSGRGSASIPPGARVFFRASSGLSAVPLDRAAVARVSVTPTYRPVG